MALNFPNSPTVGQVYTDTTSGFSYEWDGTVWKSYSAASSNQIKILDDLSSSFTGIAKTFALASSGVSINPANAQSLLITLGGVVQEPSVDYTVSNSNIVFDEAPAIGLVFGGVSLGPAVPITTIPDGTTTQGSFNVAGILSAANLNVTGITTTNRLNVSTNGVVSGILTASGGFVGDVTGTATTATTVDITNTNGLTTIYYPTFVENRTDGQILRGDVDFTYVTDDNILTVPNISATGVVVGSAVTINSSGLNVSGVVTATTFSGNITGTAATFTGNVSIAGTLTYEDVTNVDSVGLVTARTGVRIDSGGLVVTAGVSTFAGITTVTGETLFAKQINTSGIVTATEYDITGSTNTLTAGGLNVGVATATTFVGSGITITGISTATDTRLLSVGERTTIINGNTASLVYNTGGGNIAICTNPSADVTLAVTGIPTDTSFDNTAISFSVFINQTGTARSCTAVTLNGFNVTIRWAGGSLGNATAGVTTTNGMDIYSFSGINTVGSASTTANYYVLGVVNGGYK